MFTGLIKEIGVIGELIPNSTGARIRIVAPVLRPEIQIDDSVATNGICLTATELTKDGFWCQAIHQTLEKTSLSSIAKGSEVNLELALRIGDRLGGHFVQGHVNATASCSRINRRGDNYELSFQIAADQARYMIKEGSIAIDGVSLTIADIVGDSFMVSIIPHTWDNTIFKNIKVGSKVNIEVDMLAKYLENFARFERPSGLSLETLKDMGYES